MNSKPWYTSKTVWIAILQGIVGAVTAILSAEPNLQFAGGLMMLKSALDLALRFVTYQPIE